MPQLDFSFYISQITWLLISFFGFFCVSKFLILPRLEKNLSNRANLIKTNTDFAKDALEKAKKINQTCDEKISSVKSIVETKQSELLKDLKERNDKKLLDLKKRLLESENKNIIDVKKDFEKIEEQLSEQMIETSMLILQKLYCIDADKNDIKELFDKVSL